MVNVFPSIQSRILAAVLLFAFTAAPAVAGRYELIKGKGVEVCEAYEKNLNSFNPSTPMLCERLVSPIFPDFAKPAWEKLILEQSATINIETAERSLSSMSKNYRPPKEPMSERIRKSIEQIAASHNDSYPYTMQRVSIDIANNGRSVLIAREMHGKCGGVGIPMVVLRTIDKNATNPTLKNVLESAMFRSENAQVETSPGKYLPVTKREPLGSVMYPDIFHYKDGWYFDIWATQRGSSDLHVGHLYVFQHRNGKTSELCELSFHEDKR